MDNADDIAHLQNIQAVHQRNLRALEEMLANYGLDQPVHLKNSLTFEREALQNIQSRLDGLLGKPAPPERKDVAWPNNLPRRSYFVGREREMETIMDSLSPASRTFIVAIEGLGGVGKSALAVEIGYRCQERGDVTCVIWISAKESILTAQGIEEQEPELKVISDIFLTIGTLLNYPAIGAAPLKEQQRIVLDLLGKQTTLLIIDNLETLHPGEREQISAFLRKTPVTVKAIITSRDRIIEGHTVRLQGLPAEDSAKLIEWNAQQRALRLTQQQTQQIIDLTGGLPLAMIWIQSQIAMFGRPTAQVLEQLTHDPSLPLLRFCFNRSWNMLAQFESQLLLIVLGMHVDTVSREALYAIADIQDAHQGDAALADLLQLSLVQHDQSKDRFEILQLTRTFVRSQVKDLKAFTGKAEMRMAQYYLRLVVHNSGYQQWREFDRLLLDKNNILQVAQWLYKEMRRSVARRGATLPKHTLKLAEMLRDLVKSFGSVLWQRAYWYDRLTLTHAAIEAAELLGDWTALGTFRRNIGWIYFYQGDNVRAKQWAEGSLEVVQRTGDRLLIAAAKRAVGTIEVRQHHFEEAEHLLQEALNAYEGDDTNDYEIYHLGRSQNDLADLAYERGDYVTARHWYQLALATWQQPKHKDPLRHTPYSLTGLGFVAFQEGDVRQAADLFRQSAQAAETFGRAEELARAKFGLAHVAQVQGSNAEAMLLALAVLDTFRTMGMQHEIRLVQQFIETIGATEAR